MSEVIVKVCPSCGAPVEITSNICDYCGAAYYIQSIHSLVAVDKKGITKYIELYKKKLAERASDSEAAKALGICYVKLSMYDFALKKFKDLIEESLDDSDIYFYASICLMKGKRPFLVPLKSIKEIEVYLEAASMISPGNPSYYYAQGLIKQDYYERKFLKTMPTANDLFSEAMDYNLTDVDKQTVTTLLNI